MATPRQPRVATAPVVCGMGKTREYGGSREGGAQLVASARARERSGGAQHINSPVQQITGSHQRKIPRRSTSVSNCCHTAANNVVTTVNSRPLPLSLSALSSSSHATVTSSRHAQACHRSAAPRLMSPRTRRCRVRRRGMAGHWLGYGQYHHYAGDGE